MEVEKNDEVWVRGQVVWIEDNGFVRVQFPGYQYPIVINPVAIKKVIKPKPPRDIPD